MTPDKLGRDGNTKEQGVNVNSITAYSTRSDSEEAEFINHKGSMVAEEAKLWECTHSFAFESGIMHQVKAFISDRESGCNPRLLTHLGIRALLSIKISAQACKRCPSNAFGIPSSSKRLARTYAKFHQLR